MNYLYGFLLGISVGMLIGALLMFPVVISSRKTTKEKIRKMLEEMENKQ